MFFVYVLKSLKNGRRYIGQTKDVHERINHHNFGGSKATKYQGPYKLVYVEKYSTRRDAVSREPFPKTGKGYEVLKILGL